MDGLDLLPWPVQLGVIGFLILAIVSILVRHERQISKGDLIPRIMHIDAVERERVRVNDYKELLALSNARGDVLEKVSENILAIGENMDKVIKSLPSPIQERTDR